VPTDAPTGTATPAPSAVVPSPTPDPVTLRIGVSLPLSSAYLLAAGPIRDGVLTAIDEFAAPAGYRVEAVVLDDTVNGVPDPQQGAKNIIELIADPGVAAVIGAYDTDIARLQLAYANEAGLLLCSPTAADPALTREKRAPGLPAENRAKQSFVRLPGNDALVAPAVAEYGITVLGLKTVAIIDDTEAYGTAVSDAFAARWTKLGGKVVTRTQVPKGTSDYTGELTAIAALAPDAVFYGGVTASGAGFARKQMAQSGLGDSVLLGASGIFDGQGDIDGSFINIAGTAAVNSFTGAAGFVGIAADSVIATTFRARYKARTGVDPGPSAAAGYACAQVVLSALREALSVADPTMISPDLAIREAARAWAVSPSAVFDTLFGPLRFDKYGDPAPADVAIFKTDLTLPDGGGWVFDRRMPAH
jgi:branched-chain amino acid transport system substrate-binding protein